MRDVTEVEHQLARARDRGLVAIVRAMRLRIDILHAREEMKWQLFRARRLRQELRVVGGLAEPTAKRPVPTRRRGQRRATLRLVRS